MERYVVVGNSAAGLTAAETIRRLDRQGEITLVSDEDLPAYSRVANTRYLAGKVSRENVFLRRPVDYERQGLKTEFGSRAVGVNTGSGILLLRNGKEIPWTRLLLATGSKPLIPPIPGTDLPGVFPHWTLGDAGAIGRAAAGARRAVVLGAGLIGIQTALALRELGLTVTLLEKMERPMSRQLDQRSGEMLTAALRAEGVTIQVGQQVEELAGDPEGGVRGVVSNGHAIEAELVVLATGVAPDTSLAAGAGCITDHGILVDHHLATSVPGIFAAGDVAQAYDLAWGVRRVNALWTSAVEQGKLAAYNMVGERRRYEGGFSQVALQVGELSLVSLGMVQPEAGSANGVEQVACYVPERREYRKLVLRRGCLVGALLGGDVTEAGVFRYLIRLRIDVSEVVEELLKPAFNFVRWLRVVRGPRLTGIK